MSITASTATNLAGSVVPTLVSLVTIPLYIHVIGQERYGILLLIWLLLGYFGLFDLGLGRATAQRIAALATAPADARARVFWTAFVLNSALGVLGGIILWRVGEIALRQLGIARYLGAEALGVVPWLAAAVPLLTISGILSGALQGREQFLILNLVHVGGVVLSQVAPLAAAILWEGDIRLLVPVVLFTRALSCLVLLAVCRRHVPLTGIPLIDHALLRPLLRYGGWVTVTGVVGPLLTSLDRFIIGTLAGARAVTLYSVPFNLASAVSILPGSLSSTLFPRFASEGEEGHGPLLERAVRGLAAGLTPLILVAMAGMGPFLSWWLGDEFSGEAATVGQIIALGLWLNGLAYIPFTLLQACGRPDVVAKCHLLELGPYLALLLAGLHVWGIVGAAIAWSLRAGMDAGLLFWLSRVEPRHVGILVPNGLLLAAMGVLVFALPSSGHWQWILAVAVILSSAAWSWKSGAFLVAAFPRIVVPVRTGSLR